MSRAMSEAMRARWARMTDEERDEHRRKSVDPARQRYPNRRGPARPLREREQ